MCVVWCGCGDMSALDWRARTTMLAQSSVVLIRRQLLLVRVSRRGLLKGGEVNTLGKVVERRRLLLLVALRLLPAAARESKHNNGMQLLGVFLYKNECMCKWTCHV